MDKKGFTLIELLTVLIILSIISLVAVPNVVNMVEKNKKKQMVLDAKEMLNKYQNYKTLGKCKDKLKDNKCEYSFDELGLEGKQDGFGDTYERGSVSYNYNDKTYTITLKTSKHCIGKNENCDGLTATDSINFEPTVDDIYEILKLQE